MNSLSNYDDLAESREKLSPVTLLRTFEMQDKSAVLQCLIQLQDAEYELDKLKRTGESVAEEYFEEICKAMQEGEGEMVVAETDGNISGMIIYMIEENDLTEQAGRHLYVSDVVVLEQFRRLGIGHQLIDHAKKYARGHGIQRTVLNVLSENVQATAMYLKHGFRERYKTLELEM